MSGKSRVSQRQRRPSGQGQPQPGAQQPGQSKAGQENAADAHERRVRLAAARQAQRRAQRRRRIITWSSVIMAGTAAIIAVLWAIFSISGGSSTASAGQYPYQVGSPGAGQAAPGFTLAASTGGTISLSAYRGKTVTGGSPSAGCAAPCNAW